MRPAARLRVRRQRLGWLDTPTGLLSALPAVDRLVALVGDWHQGAALVAWDRMLRHGWSTVANGGSDLHGLDDQGGAVGKPTTVVYARRLAQSDVVEALRAGRSFVTRSPDGVEVYLTATRPGQETYVGGRVYGDVGLVVARVLNTAHFGGRAFDADEWTTDVLVRREQRWLCDHTHVTPVAVTT